MLPRKGFGEFGSAGWVHKDRYILYVYSDTISWCELSEPFSRHTLYVKNFCLDSIHILHIWWVPISKKSNLLIFWLYAHCTYCTFHITLPKSSSFCQLDLGKVLWSGLYLRGIIIGSIMIRGVFGGRSEGGRKKIDF